MPVLAPRTSDPGPPLESAHEVLHRVFGFHGFRGAQESVVARLLDGHDALCVMPTGSGKSLCYQIPSLVRPGVGIVVSPLIALMQDQVEALRQLGVRAAALNSSLGAVESRKVLADLHGGRLDLLYVAPERLMMDGFLDRFADIEVALLAIDEAHCISQWGHDFRPEYRDLGRLRRHFAGVPCVAVTATADAPTQRDIAKHLGMEEDDLFVTGFDRPNIRYRVALSDEPRRQLLAFLSEHEGEAGIVYAISRDKVERIAAFLKEHGVEALPYHAGLPSKTREQNQQRFLREEGVVMVATIAFGMGIDKPNVRFVAHMDVPKSPEAYYQETGRAGRDGEPSEAWMLYSLSAIVQQRRMMDNSGSEGAHKWVERHKLDAMVGYCETADCRRRVLLAYFGEDAPARCGNCDTCLDPVETWDATTEARKAMSAVVRTGQRFGTAHVIDVLRGEATDKVRRFGHDRLPTFGVGADLDAPAWRSALRQLVAGGYLAIDVDGYGRLRLTEAAMPILRGEQTVLLRKDPAPQKKGRKKKAPAAPLTVTGAGQVRFERLRTLRFELAKQQGVPPYVIFSDRTLREMAERAPHTEDELRDVNGVGEAKLARYGAAFLEALQMP
jgi:ATP-dependent DNA helicase RecQ